MKLREDSERVTVSLKEAITLLCKTGLNYSSQLHIDGLLGITLDNDQIFLVKIQEIIKTSSENCDETSTVSAGSPVSQCTSEEQQDEVMDLCVKSSTPQQENHHDTENEDKSCAEEQAKNEANEGRGEADHTELETQEDKPLVINFDSELESQSEHSQKEKYTDTAEQSNQVTTEPENKSRRRARKSKTTRHICQQNVEDLSFVSDQEETFHTFHKEYSQNSQEAASILAGVNENSCSSDDGPVNLSAHSSPINSAHSDPIVIKEESSESQNGSQNIFSLANNLNNTGSMNLLNSVTISAEPLPQLNPLVPYNEQELHAQWLTNIAAHVVQNVQHNPLVITTPQVSRAPPNLTSRIQSGSKGLIAIAPAPEKNAAQLGTHRYSPYIVPPVMGPGATLVLNQPVVKKTKAAPNAVVNCLGTAVPITSQHKHQTLKSTASSAALGSASVDSFFCANCGCTKTTTWRRNDQGQHVCNPCGLYFRLYRSSSSNNRRSQKYSANTSNKNAATHVCANCGTLVTTMWRRNTEGEPVCNACGLYFKLHQVNRPLHMAKTEIHSRRRKPKSPHTLSYTHDTHEDSSMIIKFEGDFIQNPIDLSGFPASPGRTLSTDSGGVGESGYEMMESEQAERSRESPISQPLPTNPVSL